METHTFTTVAPIELKYEHTDDENIIEIYPTHDFVKNWCFRCETDKKVIYPESTEIQDEALLAEMVARVASKNGLSANDVTHIYPAILRMLKSEIAWANNINQVKK